MITKEAPSVGDKIKDILLLCLLSIFILVGIVGTVAIVVIWILDLPIPQYFIDVGPLLLVLVTLIYIGIAGLGYREGQREREISKMSLDVLKEDLRLQKKPSILDTIALSIEPLLESLESDRTHLNKTTVRQQAYQPLVDIEFVEKDLLRDLPEHYPDLVLDIGAYRSMRNAYRGKRGDLKESLMDSIPDDMNETQKDTLLDAAFPNEVNMLLLDVTEERINQGKIKERSHNLAEIALTGNLQESGRGWVDNNIESIREAMIDFRENGPLSDDLKELEMIRNDLLRDNEKIISGLKKSKEALMEEYEIKNAEIKSRRGEFNN